ncbi:MAG: response regulator transcription factor [Pseudodesulfovibrio sp.]|nr:response regulator transcription factor [Pseudodesulfovibrio sp.]
MIRILIVDDHTLVRKGLGSMIMAEADMQVIGEAATGLESLELCRLHKPDVVVMDVSMPDMNGIEATERIMAECPGSRVVGVSMHADSFFVERMLKAGASGYLLKNSARLELLTAIREASVGRCYLSPAVTGSVVDRFVRHPDPDQESSMPQLTLREREVLQLLAEGNSSKEIAHHLSLSVRTVEHHRHQIMARLGLRSVAALTKYAIRSGLTSLEF